MLFSEISRKQAFVTHLSVSLFIFVILTYMIVFQWYPSFYFEHDGGDRGILTIFFVDVILGPGLTLLVFKQGKKGLKFDMVMILLFQMVALSWGINNVYKARPSLTVFYDGKFYCMAQEDIPREEVDRLSNNEDGPVLAFLRRPDDSKAYFEFLSEAFKSESSEIYYYNDRYESIDEGVAERIKNYELDVDEGIERSEQMIEYSKKRWEEYKKVNALRDGVGFYPLKCRYKVGMVMFDFSQKKVVDYIDVHTARAISKIELKNTLEK